jgi:hypothetical protein
MFSPPSLEHLAALAVARGIDVTALPPLHEQVHELVQTMRHASSSALYAITDLPPALAIYVLQKVYPLYQANVFVCCDAIHTGSTELFAYVLRTHGGVADETMCVEAAKTRNADLFEYVLKQYGGEVTWRIHREIIFSRDPANLLRVVEQYEVWRERRPAQ